MVRNIPPARLKGGGKRRRGGGLSGSSWWEKETSHLCGFDAALRSEASGMKGRFFVRVEAAPPPLQLFVFPLKPKRERELLTM